ncbi:NmrA family NAD(P)-binding protein [Chitinophaga vietnamensis]|uniref:NmrA family NAD(P)-binding protein n=1 Tax=Chitinophaga vietnamensis TaxID=2593957 RepID=UPI0011778FAC|nr:NmrA family NAD(P)-binding protein [Chitinophaga vietnamensis]
MNNKSHITVFGATGNIGRHLLQLLSAAQLPVIAVTRDAGKAMPLPAVQWISADMSDPASLPATMHNSHALFLLSGHSPDFVQQQTNVIKAAITSGVEHIVKLSSGTANEHSPFYIPGGAIGQLHAEVEDFLKASGLYWTMLQPNGFMQNWLGDLAATVRKERTIYEATGHGTRAYIDLRDIGEVAFKVLTEPALHRNKSYLLTGSTAVNFYEVAHLLSEALQETVTFASLNSEQAQERLLKKNIPPVAVQTLLAYATAQREGKTACVSPHVETILGRPARSVKTFIADHLSHFA